MTDPQLPYTIEIDRDVCMGSGLCMVYAAATFELDEQAKSTVLDPAGDPLDRIRVAAEACPTGAITIRTA
jgi:ferredoxin